MKILGIDPGYGILGWSVIEKSLKLIDYGTIETCSSNNIDERIFIIHNELSKIISHYKPDCVAIEKLFFSKNTKTAIDVAKAIGAILLTVRIADLEYFEYTPLQVKQAITGFGRASKSQVEIMLKKLYNVKNIHGPDDAADAVAVATCHSFRNNITNLKV